MNGNRTELLSLDCKDNIQIEQGGFVGDVTAAASGMIGYTDNPKGFPNRRKILPASFGMAVYRMTRIELLKQAVESSKAAVNQRVVTL